MRNNRIIGIDASNIHLSSGGSFTHLYEILTAFDFDKHEVDKIIVWSNEKVLTALPEKNWLEKRTHKFLNKNLFYRQLWQKYIFPKCVKQDCAVAFMPGGVTFVKHFPTVCMSRNMLPFEWRHLFQYFPSLLFLKYLLLRYRFIRSYRHSSGMIFLSNYAKNNILPLLKHSHLDYKVIPHGIDESFDGVGCYNASTQAAKDDFHFCYVSSIDKYKHHDVVLRAFKLLVDEGYRLKISFAGRGNKKNIRRFLRLKDKVDRKQQWSDYCGFVDYSEINKFYKKHDGFVYASSCENFPNILIQAMRAHLPILCSNVGVMPEIIEESAFYFNPYSSESLVLAIKQFVSSKELRHKKSNDSYRLSLKYDWRKCAFETFSYVESFID